MKKERKKYTKPEVIRIPIDFRRLIKNQTGGGGGYCPYLFVWNGINYVRENSLLPDSEDLWRKEKLLTDYYVLKNLPQAKNGYLSFKIKEVSEDISWFKKFEMISVEIDKNYSIGYTPEGKLSSYFHPKLPKEIVDGRGNSLWNKLGKNMDDIRDYFRSKPGDEIYLDFGKVESNFAKLVIVDPRVYAQRDGCINVHGMKSIFVFYINFNSFWEEVTVLHTRAEFYPDIIDLTPYLPQIKENLKVRLQFSAEHKVSFVGLDISEPIPLKTKTYSLAQALHSEFGDVTDILKGAESEEFVRLYPGEEIELKFPVPEPPKPGNKLSYVLVTEGYYLPIEKIVSLAKTKYSNLVLVTK